MLPSMLHVLTRSRLRPSASAIADFALDVMLYMLSQHHAIGLQNDCTAVVPTPMVRLPDTHVYALWL